MKRHFGDLVYDVIIPRTVRLSEAPGFGQPITIYDAKSKGAEAYRQLAQEVALRPPPEAPMPQFDKMPIAVMPRWSARRTPRPPRTGGIPTAGGAPASGPIQPCRHRPRANLSST